MHANGCYDMLMCDSHRVIQSQNVVFTKNETTKANPEAAPLVVPLTYLPSGALDIDEADAAPPVARGDPWDYRRKRVPTCQRCAIQRQQIRFRHQ
jgi:hypothetical protein